MHVGIARDALHIAQRLFHCLTQRDANILGGVVLVDMQIALGPDRQVDPRMPRQEIEHMVKEANSGRDRGRTSAVEVDRHLNVGFLGSPLHGGFTHCAPFAWHAA
jgi:hypothetical protein